MKLTNLLLGFILIGSFACSPSEEEKTIPAEVSTDTVATEEKTYEHKAFYTDSITIDGKDTEEAWAKAEYYPLDYVILGDTNVTEEDFTGKFKLAWNEAFLYVMVKVKDDSLIDIYEDKLVQWWDDDCVEIFIDEDNSDEEHQFNHSAFAYHVGLSYDVVDLGPDRLPHLYNDHVLSARTFDGEWYTWECAVRVFDKSFVDNEPATPVTLTAGKEMGFMLAYCDNDTSATRENFIGSIEIEGEDKDRGWIDSGVFGTLLLVKGEE